MLEVKNLHATIAGKEILKGINLTINDGEPTCCQVQPTLASRASVS